jgi:drug/metabolite transporter (DMT)-like permease
MKILLIFVSVIFGVFGQIFFKKAVTGVGSVSIIDAAIVSVKSIYFWTGGFLYGASLILWMKILADTDLSYARPFSALGYVAITLIACFYLGESISPLRWTGIILIATGVFLVART